MRTYPEVASASRQMLGFEIDRVYVSPSTIANVLSTIPHVTDIRKRRPFGKWDEIHVWFHYKGRECVVWEPFGDSTRFWIGQKTSEEPVDLQDIEKAFRLYQPSLFRRMVGDVLTLRVLSWLKRRFNHNTSDSA